jgi:Ran GTPase-activating protein (RanGAP) involved in mRNA processing and transport
MEVPPAAAAITGAYTTAEDLLNLLQQIRSNSPAVQHVDLSRRRLPAAYLKALFVALATNRHVTHLNLARSGVMTDLVARTVADCLRRNNTLTDLDLTKSGLSNAACRMLAAALQHRRTRTNSALRRLSLEGNAITDVGVRALCDAMPGTGLCILKLGKHMLGEVGARSIAKLLRRPDCPLRRLDLRSCHLGDGGASLLAAAMPHNSSLHSLCLGRNHIGDGAVQQFAVALQQNTMLQTLDLQYNRFTDAGVVALVRCLETRNDSVQKVKLRYCDAVSVEMKEKLLDILLVNSHGPNLAQKTKKALRSLLLDESFSERSGSASCCNYDGGSEDGIVREVPPAASQSMVCCNVVPEDCVICFDVPAECALLPCKHRNCCTACALQLKTCHMCRETIVKVYPLRGGGGKPHGPTCRPPPNPLQQSAMDAILGVIPSHIR